jgi:hypothetical protein
MKLLQVISSDGTRLYGAMIRKQAAIRRNGRGTFLRARARKRNAVKWTHHPLQGIDQLQARSLEGSRGRHPIARPRGRSATTVIVSGLAR